jgi:uncharacterized protein (TIGR02246 family)
MWRFLALCASLGLVFCSACSKGPDTRLDEEAIRQVLSKYVSSIEKEDMNLYAELVADDPVMVNFGAFGDPILGWDGLKDVMEEQSQVLEKTTITVRDVRVHVARSASIAWATSLWDFKTTSGGRELNLPIRCSWILEKRKGKWVIVHFHKSLAA